MILQFVTTMWLWFEPVRVLQRTQRGMARAREWEWVTTRVELVGDVAEQVEGEDGLRHRQHVERCGTVDVWRRGVFFFDRKSYTRIRG